MRDSHLMDEVGDGRLLIQLFCTVLYVCVYFGTVI